MKVNRKNHTKAFYHDFALKTQTIIQHLSQKIIHLKIYQKFIIVIIADTIIGLLIEKFAYPTAPFSILRFLLGFFAFLFAATPFCIFEPKAAFDFIFRKRYWIAAFVFIFLVLGGFHGSSIYELNNYIQPGIRIESSEPIAGKSRPIRSDEWATSSLTTLSQIPNNLEPESSIMNGYPKNVTFYPSTVSKSLNALSNPRNYGYFFLPVEQAFAFSWWIGFFILFFATLEFLMLITKRNRLLSTLGAFLVTFSPAVQWWESWNMIAYGELAIVLFNLLLKKNKLYQEILLSIAIGIIGCCYIMCLYPAWQIPYGYLFLILAIWVIKNNLKNCNVRKFVILFISILASIGIIIIPAFLQSYDIYKLITSTVYPGSRFSTGGFMAINHFDYFGNLFMPFDEPANSSNASQFISLFPIPIIMGVYYWFNNHKTHKKDFLLVSLTVISILFCIWNFIPLPAWFTKISLLSMSTPIRTVTVVGFTCTLLIIYCLSNYSSQETVDSRTKYLYLVIATITTILGTYAAYNCQNYVSGDQHYMNPAYIVCDLIIFIPVIYFIMLNRTISSKVILSILTLIVVFSGLNIHPLSRGLDILYKKPIAQEIQKIEAEEPDATWFVVDSNWPTNDYPTASGADTINSTNYFPNFELYRKLGLEDQDQIYNRYAHIVGNVSNEPTSLTKIGEDLIILNVNNNDVCKIDIDYLFVHNQNLDQYDTEKVDFTNLYEEDYFSIYQVNCQE